MNPSKPSTREPIERSKASDKKRICYPKPLTSPSLLVSTSMTDPSNLPISIPAPRAAPTFFHLQLLSFVTSSDLLVYIFEGQVARNLFHLFRRAHLSLALVEGAAEPCKRDFETSHCCRTERTTRDRSRVFLEQRTTRTPWNEN